MNAKPDPKLTPGAWGTVIVSRDVPAALKRAVYKSYGIGLLRRVLFVVDHLVPLELGGLNLQANLWPQPRREAKKKDLDENRLAAAVAGGNITLAEAQTQILKLWGA
jgi:hypothetical protein